MPEIQNLNHFFGLKPCIFLKYFLKFKIAESLIPRALNLKVWDTNNQPKSFFKNKNLVQILAEAEAPQIHKCPG